MGIGGDEAQLLRLAGLLHDIGQYPLSHVIETVYRLRPRPLNHLIVNPEVLEPVVERPTLQKVSARPPGTEYARDKALAGEVITRRPDIVAVLKRHDFSEDRIEEIAKIVRGKHASTLYRHLLDSDYDCDRLDYLRRDARMAGVPYGEIDLDYLIQNMSSHVYPPNGADKVLAIEKRKALHSLEHYLTSRYYMYSQVVFHKTVCSFELLAKALYYELAEQELVYPDYDAIVADVENDSFLDFNDHQFWEHARQAAQRAGRTAAFARRLLRREPLNFLLEFKCLANKGEVSADYAKALNWLLHPNNLETVCADAGLDPQLVATQELGIEFVPIGSDVSVEDLLARPDETRTAVLNSPYLVDDDGRLEIMIKDESTILRALSTQKLRILRLYIEGDDETGNRLRESLRARMG